VGKFGGNFAEQRQTRWSARGHRRAVNPTSPVLDPAAPLSSDTTRGIIKTMPCVQKIVAALRNSQTNVRYADLFKVCAHYFGNPRQEKTSHAKFATHWAGEPYVNIQNKNGQAKPYQAKQVLAAIDKLEGKE
jgi:hypothetical protein